MTQVTSLAWARKVDDALKDLDKIPLFGNAPLFDIDLISSVIASHFQAPSIKIEIGDCAWRSEKKIKEGLGSNIISLGITVSPLANDVFWLMGQQDVARFTGWMMDGKSQSKTIRSEILQEGFYRYLALQALDALQTIEPFKEFSLKMSEESDCNFENTYCLDVKITFMDRSCWGRLVLSASFMASWQRHFASMRELFSLTPLAQTITVPVSICTGTCKLSMKEWKSLEIGDFVLLNRGGYDPRHHEGIATLSLGSTPLFQVSIKENKVKLIDYSLFYEESMPKTPNEPLSETNSIAASQEEQSIAIKELPLIVTVELAKIHMTVAQLMKLSPGNFLELPIHANQEVALTVNGQKIGRAELVHLGEALGIRIIETA